MKAEKIQQAQKLLDAALAEGCVLRLEGNWYTFTPPPSNKVFMEWVRTDPKAFDKVAKEHLSKSAHP